jgi:Fe2+-dicitrate sensor, membrane component
MNKDQTDNILRQLKKRTLPDAEKQQAAKQAVMAHWQNNLKKQRHHRFVWTAAVAASTVMVFALVLFVNLNSDNNQLSNLYQQVDIHGTIMLEQGPSKPQPMTADTSLNPGDIIHSAENGYVIWHLNDGSELRQAPDTRIAWQTEQRIDLLAGQLFHNTDVTQSAKPLVISTKLGSVSHVGTQYVVNHQPNTLQVAVKTGRVNINSFQETHTVEHNELISISPSGVESIQTSANYNHPMWSWTFKTEQPYSLNGQSLYDFVVWISRKADLTVNWQGQQEKAKNVSLQGTINNMTVDMALKTVFASTDYHYQIQQGRLQISPHEK